MYLTPYLVNNPENYPDNFPLNIKDKSFDNIIQQAWDTVEDLRNSLKNRQELNFSLTNYVEDNGKGNSPYFFTFPADITITEDVTFKKFKNLCLLATFLINNKGESYGK